MEQIRLMDLNVTKDINPDTVVITVKISWMTGNIQAVILILP